MFVQTGESHTTPGVRPDVWPDVRVARVSSVAPKKKSFDRGGPVWPPRSNVTNDRLRGSGGAKSPWPKTGGSGGQRPPAKTQNFSENFRKNSKKFSPTHLAYPTHLLLSGDTSESRTPQGFFPKSFTR